MGNRDVYPCVGDRVGRLLIRIAVDDGVRSGPVTPENPTTGIVLLRPPTQGERPAVVVHVTRRHLCVGAENAGPCVARGQIEDLHPALNGESLITPQKARRIVVAEEASPIT